MPMPMASAAIYHNIQCLAAALVCHLSLETGPSAARGGHQCIFHAEVFGGGLHNLECPEGLGTAECNSLATKPSVFPGTELSRAKLC